ncbi:inorganic diphosphatase, partial [Pseudomonas syringae group genomosp. 7]|uniref:inorganic diphosphatase n=1 Tax=Pseudomonas syringae group genomosp. 7 TaxID=251699 RepID=UPI00376FA345
VIASRAVGCIFMTDEAVEDDKFIAVTHENLCAMYCYVTECSDLPSLLLAQIHHILENYKAL